jgi:signal transduction histidine kinase
VRGFSGVTKRWARWSLATKALVVMSIPLAPLLLTTAIFYVADRREQGAQAASARAAEVYAELQATLMLVVDAETGTRGFLLTGERRFLEHYTRAIEALPRHFERLDALVTEPTVRDGLGTFRRLASSRLEWLRPLVAAPWQRNDPLLLDKLHEGKRRMDTVRAVMAQLMTLERRLLEERRARAARFERTTLAVVLAGALLGILGGVGASVLFTHSIVRRVRHVQENAESLASAGSLRAGPDGGDEVGALGRSVHHVADLLRDRDTLLRVRVDELDLVNKELEAFSYSVSHDLRAPLRHVAGFAVLLEKSAAGRFTEQDSRYVRTIVDAAARMGRLVDDLLAFSRMGRSEMLRTRVDLEPLVDEIIGEQTRDQNGREIVWKRSSLPAVPGDPAMLRIALSNLISNAVKYTSTRERAEIEIGAAPSSNGEQVLFVRDNGVGFDMLYADKLFGVFQRLHGADEFEGTGIGLANVRRVIQRHGGRTWAEGSLDGGATFYMALPGAQVMA